MDSLQYKHKVCSFNTTSVEQYVLWKKDLEKLIIGQSLELASDKFAMMRKVLRGDALAVFNQHAHATVDENDETFKECMNQMLDDANYIMILEFGILDSWQAKIVNPNFISANHMLTEIIRIL